MIEWTFLKESILIKQANKKSAIFFTIGQICQPYVCNRYHDSLMIYKDLSDIYILNINGVDYHCIISGISKTEAINLMQNIDLTEKIGTW